MTFMDLASKVQTTKLTYLNDGKLRRIAAQIQKIKQNNVPGDFVEFGVALGGSGICIANELDADRRFIGFDVFGMIPPPGEADGPGPLARYETIRSGRSVGIGGDRYYGYIDNLQDLVIRNFADFGLEVDGEKISLVPGLYQDTASGLAGATIAFAHIDCDWYGSVMTCLNCVLPSLSSGGIIVLDDYNDWPGCRKATDEFVGKHPELSMVSDSLSCVLTKA